MAPKVPEVIQCNAASFVYELENIAVTLAQAETEDTWDAMGRAVQRWTALVKGGAPAQEHLAGLRTHSRPLIRSLNSERTILSGHVIALLEHTALTFNSEFEPLCPVYVPVLLGLTTRTVKLYISRSKACLLTIVTETRPLYIIGQLRQSSEDKSISLRLAATELILSCLNDYNPADLAKDSRARDIESIIKTTARDANTDVRKASRKAYEAYSVVLADRVSEFLRPLTPTTRKYLGLKNSDASRPASRPESAMSRPTSRAEAGRKPNFATTSTSSRPPQEPRSRTQSSNLATTPTGMLPPALIPAAGRSAPAQAVPRAPARRVVPDIAPATESTATEGTHVRSNTLRGGALNSGAPGDRPAVRGPARVAIAPPAAMNEDAESQSVASGSITTRPAQPAAPARSRTVPNVKPSEATTTNPGPRRMQPNETNATASTSNAKSSGISRSTAAPVRPPARAPPVTSSTILSRSTAGVPKEAPKVVPKPRAVSTTSAKPHPPKATSEDIKRVTASSSRTQAVPARPAATSSERAPTVSKHGSVSKPAPRLDVGRSVSSSQSKPPPKEAPKKPVVPRDISRPTASQLSRSQPLATAKKDSQKDTKAKPMWGRSAPPPAPKKTRPSPSTTTAPRQGARLTVRPEAVPLPQSPKRNKTKAASKEVKKAAAVPLPPSPSLQQKVVPSSESLDQDVLALELDEVVVAPSPPQTEPILEAADSDEDSCSKPAETPVAPYPAEDPAEVADEDELSDGEVDVEEEDTEEDEVEEPLEGAAIPAAPYPIEGHTIDLGGDDEDDLDDLQPNEEDGELDLEEEERKEEEDLVGDLPASIEIEANIHHEGEDMQLSDVVEHGRSLTDEVIMQPPALHVNQSTPIKSSLGVDHMQAPTHGMVPATPISSLLSSIQQGFLPSPIPHSALSPSPPQDHHGFNSLQLPSAFPLRLAAADPRSYERLPLPLEDKDTVLFGVKGLVIPTTTRPQTERGVLTEKKA